MLTPEERASKCFASGFRSRSNSVHKSAKVHPAGSGYLVSGHHGGSLLAPLYDADVNPVRLAHMDESQLRENMSVDPSLPSPTG